MELAVDGGDALSRVAHALATARDAADRAARERFLDELPPPTTIEAAAGPHLPMAEIAPEWLRTLEALTEPLLAAVGVFIASAEEARAAAVLDDDDAVAARWIHAWDIQIGALRSDYAYLHERLRRLRAHIAAATVREDIVATLDREGRATPERVAAAEAVERMQRESVDNGTDRMTIDEIDAVVAEVRRRRRERAA